MCLSDRQGTLIEADAEVESYKDALPKQRTCLGLPQLVSQWEELIQPGCACMASLIGLSNKRIKAGKARVSSLRNCITPLLRVALVLDRIQFFNKILFSLSKGILSMIRKQMAVDWQNNQGWNENTPACLVFTFVQIITGYSCAKRRAEMKKKIALIFACYGWRCHAAQTTKVKVVDLAYEGRTTLSLSLHCEPLQVPSETSAYTSSWLHAQAPSHALPVGTFR